ncbi:MAG: hypothetical protein Ta2B_11460 [Termitinemataceae bacterium]|nr:MAG: hypothetical protein Ta2B_11460 [Termitinemataceae bacterium]
MKKRVFIGFTILICIAMLCAGCVTAGPIPLDPALPAGKAANVYWSQSGHNFYPTTFNEIKLKTKNVMGSPILADGTYLEVPEGAATVEGTIFIMDVSWSNDGYGQVKNYSQLLGIYQFSYTFKSGMTYFVEPYIDEKQVLNVKIYDEVGKKYYLPPKKDPIAIVPVKEIKRIR